MNRDNEKDRACGDQDHRSRVLLKLLGPACDKDHEYCEQRLYQDMEPRVVHDAGHHGV